MAKYHPKKKHINRLSSYVTFVPRERQPEEIKQLRIGGYHDGVSTSHYADRFECKTVPLRSRGTFAKRNLKHLEPLLDENGEIPLERLRYI